MNPVVLLVFLSFAPQAPALAKAAAKPSAGKVKELVAKYFAADAAARADLVVQLGAADLLAPADVKKWAPTLLELARKGQKIESGGTNYLLDEKEKVGKYIVQGAKRAKQLVVCLHGGGAGEGDAASAMSGFSSAFSKLKDVVVVYPEVLHKTEHGWTEDDTEPFILALIEAAKRTHPIDPNHVYLTGHSMGGFGTWTLGARYADLFGGLAAFAGAPTPYFDKKEKTKVVGVQEGVLPNLFNLPIFVYQSGDDKNVPPAVNDFAMAEMKKLYESVNHSGWQHVFERVEGRGHDFPAGGPEHGVEWAMSHVRDPRPKKIVWQPFRTWKKCFYWLRCEAPPLGKELTAAVTGPNVIELNGGWPAKGVSLFLDERLVDLAKEVTVKIDGAVKYTGIPELRLSTMLATAAERNDAEYVFAAEVRL